MSFSSKRLKFFLKLKLPVLWTTASILIIYFILFSIKHLTTPSNGFASYYTASRLLIDGENPSNFYNDNFFSEKVEKFVPGIYEIYLVNLPTTSLLTFVVARYDYESARVLWITLNLLLFVVTITFIIKRMGFNKSWLPFLLILIFSFQPLYANIVSAQAYILIFCLMTFIFWGYTSDKYKIPGIFIGIIFILKSAGISILLLLAIQKKWKIFFTSVVTISILIIITLPIFGLDSWLVYSDKLLKYSSSPFLSVTAYQSVHSFFHHFFVFDQKWNPSPIFNLPLLAKTLTILFTLIIIIVSARVVIMNNNLAVAFGTFVIAGLILNPSSIDYHYMLIFIPIVVLIDWLRKNSSLFHWAIFIASFLFIAIGFPYTSSKITGGFWAVFAYPKLYGALGMWFLSLRALIQTGQEVNRH